MGEQLKDQIRKLLRQLRSRKSLKKEDEKQPELHLPAMQMLTSKNSIQAFFLRILKVRLDAGLGPVLEAKLFKNCFKPVQN